MTIVGGAGVDPEMLQPAPAAAAAAASGRGRRPHAVVEGHRRRRRGGARPRTGRGAPWSCRSSARPIRRTRKAIPEETLRAWERRAGIAWHGATRDVAAVWRDHHVCLPALARRRGPAAHAARSRRLRPRHRHHRRARAAGAWCGTGSRGFSSRAGRCRRARRRAPQRLAADPALVARMGEAARARVLDGFTERARDGGREAALARGAWPLSAIAGSGRLHPRRKPAFCRCRTRRRSLSTSPTRRRSCGRRPRRSSARSACRRPSGPSPGRAARRLPATSSTSRRRSRGRRVLDFASGSGLVAIAAAKAGAAARRRLRHRRASPIAAIGLNAAANGVAVEALARDDLSARDEGWDTVLAGDICYERDTRRPRSPPGSRLSRARGADGADRRSGPQLPAAGARSKALATYEVPVTRALEDAEIKRTSVWGFRSARGLRYRRDGQRGLQAALSVGIACNSLAERSVEAPES